MWLSALVFLVVSRAFADVGGTQLGIGDVINNLPLLSSKEVSKALELAGDYSNIHIETLKRGISDLANSADRRNQELGLIQLVTLIGSGAPGFPGDSCLEADFTDRKEAWKNKELHGRFYQALHEPDVDFPASVAWLRFGDLFGETEGFVCAIMDEVILTNNYRRHIMRDGTVDVCRACHRPAVCRYIPRWKSIADLIVQLVTDKDSLLFVTGPLGNCKDAGRIYQFEKAWDLIREHNIWGSEAIKEIYDADKRLYDDEDPRSRNAAAAITVVSLPQFKGVLEKAEAVDLIAKFVKSISSGDVELVTAYAQAVKDALSSKYCDID